MPDILLSTLNARYIHAAFGLRYLLANLGELSTRAALAEFEIGQRPLEIVERLLAAKPRLIGFGVYIWNVAPLTEVVTLLKRLRPDLPVILGGPEVSYPSDLPPVAALADHIVTGEADLAFAELCRTLLAGGAAPRIMDGGAVPLANVVLPYDRYEDVDVAQRIVYVEASRGCAFRCEFCLSSLDVPVRAFPLEAFLASMQRLLDRGVRHFKFVDRTFNLNLRVSRTILTFFLERLTPGLFLHFEMIPDRLPPELRELLRQFPPGSIQLEIGIQTFNPEVARRISREQDNELVAANLQFLREQTGAHLHADLIAGLPGETLESFAAGFDQLIALRPHEIQVGILKRLRGTPIARHDDEWGMVYSPLPPYEILASRTLDFDTVQRLRRFARYWDLVGNSGNFVETTPLLWAGNPSPFDAFMAFSDWLSAVTGRTHGIALTRLAEFVHRYLVEELKRDRGSAEVALRRDYNRAGRGDDLPFLREPGSPDEGRRRARLEPRRQRRHQGKNQ